MDHHCIEIKNDSGDVHHSRSGEKISPPKARVRLKLHDRLKSEKSNSCYTDFHHEIKRSGVDIPPKPLGVPQRLRVEKKDVKDDELVKYMSNLPSYLERGGNLKDKPLHVGVLDWGRLEKWQYKQNQVPSGTRRHSTSSSYTSFLSTAGSSAHPSGGLSCSPSSQRIQHCPTLRSHLMASPQGSNSQRVSSFEGNHGALQNWNADPEQPFSRTNQSFHEKNAEMELEHLNESALDSKMVGTSRSSENGEVASRWKLKKKDQAIEYTKRAENLQEPILDHINVDGSDAKSTAILLGPEDSPRSSHVGVSHFSDLTAAEGRESAEVSQSNFSERYSSDEVCDVPYFDILSSGPLQSVVGGSSHLDTKQSSSMDAESSLELQHGKVSIHIPSTCSPLSAHSSKKNVTQSLKFSSDAKLPLPDAAQSQSSPIRSRTSGENKSTVMPVTSEIDKHCDGLDQKSPFISAEKMRNPSPTRHFSFQMVRLGQTSISKEGATLPKPNSTLNTAKSFLWGVQSSAHMENSSDKASASRRARPSPLGRLLDPIRKPKMVNCHQSGKPLANDTTVRGVCESFDGRLYSSSVHPMKTKLSFTSCKSVEVNDAHRDEKHKLTAMQALLQVAAKNGLPLFTFAVDGNTDILAATMRMPTDSTKDCFSWTYTFFMVREIKKKGGRWMNQGGKGKGHSYIPDIVAEMGVSGHHFDGSTSHSLSAFSVREFVLFAVDKKQTDEQTLEFHPSTELAAIVTKSLRDGQQKNEDSGLSENFQKYFLSEESCYSHFVENAKDGPPMGHQVPLGMTVILPRGVHGLPDKGLPPSLIERWISGGSCDCGGWDLGCKLRILASQNKKTSCRGCPTINLFELFMQEEVEENQLVFSLSLFKDNVYSVKYNSALLPLQAFSICLAILHSKNQYETLGLNNLWKERSSDDMIFEEDYGTKDPGQSQEIAARYISYPPHSPVGRV